MSLSTCEETDLQSSGTSSQTGPSHSEMQPWDMLHSSTNEYQFHRFRFNGSFSDVAECKDMTTKQMVAIKILKRRGEDSHGANKELTILKRLSGLVQDNIVQFLEHFDHNGHICLAFEMLDKNLHHLLSERHGNLLSLQEIKTITQQLLAALESLKTAGVIHTHIKPHNIMLVSQEEQPLRVKLVDFGSAITVEEIKCCVITQPVGYRSPDVILGLPISEAVDMWSLGCVLATMYLSTPLFPQRCQYCLMKAMVETLGQLEDELLSDGINTMLYFSPNEDSTKPAWRLKTADEYKAATGFPPHNQIGCSICVSCLDDLLNMHPEESLVAKKMFISLLREMLDLHPQKRPTPSEALIRPFLIWGREDDHVDSSSHKMASDIPTSVSPMVESPDISPDLNSTDEESAKDANTATIMSLTDVNSSVSRSSDEDSSASSSDVKNVPVCVCSNEASDGSAVSADTATIFPEETLIAPAVTGPDDTISAGCDASDSTPQLADHNTCADEALQEVVRAESNDADAREEESALRRSGDESFPAVDLNCGDSDAGGSCDEATHAVVGSSVNDEAAVYPTDAEENLVMIDPCDTGLVDRDSVTTVDSLYIGEDLSPALKIGHLSVISSKSSSSTNTDSSLLSEQEPQLWFTGFLYRVLRVLCCCFSVDTAA